MNLPRFVFRVVLAALFLVPVAAVTTHAQDQDKQQDQNSDQAKQQKNPFAPEPAPPLPPGMTGSSTTDPRYKLSPGMYNAGETEMGMKHLAFVKKSDALQLGATSPDDPKVQKTLGQMGIPDVTKIPKSIQIVIAQLAFGNSDLAFEGNHLFQGNFYGMSIFDISNPAKPSLTTTMICPGGQGDVSVYKNLMFMSVEMPNGRIDCGTEGFPPEAPSTDAKDKDKGPMDRKPAAQKERFRGVRIFDISNIANPKQVAAVQTCRGSHTHTLVLDPNDKDNVYIYVSGTSFVRQPEEMAGCSDEAPNKDPNTALFRIDVIKVPVNAPQDAKIVSNPRVFMDPRTGAINGLSNGGSLHKDQEKPEDTNQCHDITAYAAIGLAAGACSGNGLILDIKDPVHPKRVDAVNDPNYSYWHSATFNNDGSKVLFTDEWGGGLGARCRPNDPNKWGADAIFDLKDDKLSLQSYYKMPAAQGDTENCVAHNGSLVPVPGRDIEVQAWYQGGVSVVDFTDAMHPQEIAYFDRGPIDPNMLVLGGFWAAYWYNGHIYGTEIARGLDVFDLTPTANLSKDEIEAAKTVWVDYLNVQNQQKIEWPNQMVVARAYLDQLQRDSGLAPDRIAALRKAAKSIDKEHPNAKNVAKVKEMSASIQQDASSAKSPQDAERLRALAAIFSNPAPTPAKHKA